MVNVWVLANPCLGDVDVARKRGFSTPGDMRLALLDLWDKTVKPGEVVYVCGSVGNPEFFELFMDKRPGRKIRLEGAEGIYSPAFWFDTVTGFAVNVTGVWGTQAFGAGQNNVPDSIPLVWDDSPDSATSMNVNCHQEGNLHIFNIKDVAKFWASVAEGSVEV
jgi:hypothetical protein